MKKSRIAAITFALAMVNVALALAQAPKVQLELTPYVGGSLFAGDMPATFQLQNSAGGSLTLSDVVLDDAVTFGGRGAIRMGERLALGATLFYTPLTYSSSSASDHDGGLYTYGADVSYHAANQSRKVTPFAVLGVGAKTYDFDGAELETDLMWNAGAGVDLQLGRGAALRLEARDYMSLFDPELSGVDEELQHDVIVAAGLSFKFGSGRPAHAARGR